MLIDRIHAVFDRLGIRRPLPVAYAVTESATDPTAIEARFTAPTGRGALIVYGLKAPEFASLPGSHTYAGVWAKVFAGGRLVCDAQHQALTAYDDDEAFSWQAPMYLREGDELIVQKSKIVGSTSVPANLGDSVTVYGIHVPPDVARVVADEMGGEFRAFGVGFWSPSTDEEAKVATAPFGFDSAEIRISNYDEPWAAANVQSGRIDFDSEQVLAVSGPSTIQNSWMKWGGSVTQGNRLALRMRTSGATSETVTATIRGVG